MEIMILAKENFEDLLQRLQRIEKQLSVLSKSPLPASEEYFNNKEFIKFCKISLRTAQKLRDEKRISFIQVGKKILYRKSDVLSFLNSQLIK
ncbi:MAG: helix-turn-helix domain-containing protein [Cytophagaceae bacterium]